MKSSKLTRRTRMLGLSVTALLSGCLVTGQALAQAQSTDSSNQSSKPTASKDKPAEGDSDDIVVVVTAEKRAEGIKNIPIAITAVSGDTLKKAGVTDVADLTQLAPSLQFGTRSTNIFIAIRGVSQAGQDIGSQSAVTVSLDGVPLLNHFMMNPAFVDVERVEVLRGPQGTISGRNATGGAINIYSKAPTSTPGGDLALNLGDYNRFGISGDFSGPLSDKVSARLSFQRERADGWLKNAYLGERLENTDLSLVRGQLLFKPTDKLSVRTLFEYSEDHSRPQFAVIFGRADPNVPAPQELPSYAYPKNDIGNLTEYINNTNRRDVKDIRDVVTARYEFGSGAAITSTTGYIKHDIALRDIDVDLTPANSSTFSLIGLYAKQFTQEFTLTTDLGSRADLVAGVFYMNAVSSEPLFLDLGSFNIKNYLVYLPTEKLKSYAAYAQFRYNITDKLRATIGGRFTRDQKSYDMDATAGAYHTLLAAKNQWESFTPRFVLDYTPNDNTLIYASAARGFKSGGFNTLGDITQPVNTFNPEYDWNYEIGTKAAFFDRKLRIGLTGFISDYTSLQQTVFVLNEATSVRFPKVLNASDATIKGIELEFEAAPTDRLRFTGGITHLDATYKKFCNNDTLYPNLPTAASCVGVKVNGQALPPGAQELEGNHLTQAPEWQFNTSGQYSFPVSGTLWMTARADYKWQSKIYFDVFNHPLNAQGSYGLLNLSLGVGPINKSWALTAWVRNASDERYISSANLATGANPTVVGSVGTPRMYGATLSKRF